MNIGVVLLSLTTILGSVVATTDYCDPAVCANYYVKHAACGHNNKFSATCPTDAVLVNIDDNLKAFIIAQINSQRNLIAADLNVCRMGTVHWDDELAHLASLNVMKCTAEGDCAETPTYKNWDQLKTQLRVEDGVELAAYFQEALMDSANVNLDTATPEQSQHYIQIWLQNNYGVGCAAARYTDPVKGPVYDITCNYGTLFSDDVEYNFVCHEAGTECKTGRNPSYANLCSAEEVYEYL